MPWHPPGGPHALIPSVPALSLPVLGVPAVCLALGTWSATLAGDLASAAYLLVAEALAVLGSSMDVALERHSRSRVLALAETRGVLERVTRRLEHLPTYVVTARLARFLGQALLVIGIAWLAFREQLQGGDPIGATPWGTFAWVLLALFLLIFLVNDVLVRLAMARRPNRVLLRTFPYLAALRWILAPLRVPLVWTVRLLLRIDLDAASPSAREEILETVEEGEREGSFTSEEAEMIGSIIEMETSLVKDVLTPRADMVTINADAPLDEAVELVSGDGYSRVPVYGQDKDDIVGLLYAHDLLDYWRPGGDSAAPTVRDLMRKPFFVPENKPLNDLMREMRARKVHLAVVLNEFNGTEGIITIEDLLEEIVGEIEDEYDEDEPPAPPLRETLARGAIEVEGRLPLQELNEHLEVDLPVEEGFETLGGLVFHLLGKVPSVGEQVQVGAVVVTVLEADERKARRLRVEVLALEEEPATGPETGGSG